MTVNEPEVNGSKPKITGTSLVSGSNQVTENEREVGRN